MAIDTNKILFNAAGVLVCAFGIGYMVNDQLTSKKTAACASRYTVSTLFSLHNAKGEMLTPIELQAQAGAREHGMLDHASVVKAAGAPAPAVLEVKVPKTQGKNARGVAAEASGVGMRWTPVEIAGASSACLSYSIYLPADFQYGETGVLPGLFGGSGVEMSDRRDGKAGFGARVNWRDGGVGDVVLFHAKKGEKEQRTSERNAVSVVRDRFQLPRGKWINIEQEIVLNTPAKPDGRFRLWVDGALKLESNNVPWRDDASVTIDGVIGNIGFGTPDRPASPPADARLQLAPYELRWM